jgi:hypothetical protein
VRAQRRLQRRRREEVLLRRRLSVPVVVAYVMLAAMLVVLSAGPAFGEAERFRFLVTQEGAELTVKVVVTPSGKVNCTAHYRLDERDGGGGGGAEHFESRTLRIRTPTGGVIEVEIGPATFKGVQTPNGKVNASCHGRLLEE